MPERNFIGSSWLPVHYSDLYEHLHIGKDTLFPGKSFVKVHKGLFL